MQKFSKFLWYQLWCMFLFFIFCLTPAAARQRTDDFPAGTDLVLLYPGESTSLNFRYNGLFWEDLSCHTAVIAAFALDEQVHELSVNISPLGDDGYEFTWFTSGFFIGAGSLALGLEILPFRIPAGYEDVNYSVDLNPFSIGVIFSAIINEFPFDSQHDGDDFDYPVDMTMTLTLAN